MVILVYGQNSFTVKQYLDDVVSRFQEKFDKGCINQLILPDLNSKGLMFGEVSQAVNSMPFLAQKRLVIVKDFLKNVSKEDIENWIELAEKTPETTIFVITVSLTVKDTERRTIFKRLSKVDGAHMHPCPIFSTEQQIQWAKTYLLNQGIKLKNDQIFNVVSGAFDQFSLQKELDKYIAFSRTDVITDDVFSKLSIENAQDKMFILMDKIADNNKSQAITMLYEQRQSGSHDLQIFSMLMRQIRLLSAAKTVEEAPELAKKMGVHPFVARKIMAQSRNLSLDKLKKMHEQGYLLDGMIKHGRISANSAVDRLFLWLIA